MKSISSNLNENINFYQRYRVGTSHEAEGVKNVICCGKKIFFQNVLPVCLNRPAIPADSLLDLLLSNRRIGGSYLCSL